MSDILQEKFTYLAKTSLLRKGLNVTQLAHRLKRRTGGLKRANFLAGFFYGISSQLRKQRDQILLEDNKYAIVLADQARARETELGSIIGPTKTIIARKTRRNSSALMKGYYDGKSAQISPALTSGNNHLQLTR